MRLLLIVVLLSLVKHGQSSNSLATLFDGPSPDTSYADGDKVSRSDCSVVHMILHPLTLSLSSLSLQF